MQLSNLTYAGHSAALVSAPNYCVAIDPWLDGNPSCPSELKNPRRLDLIILTHGHSDHASEAAHLAQKYCAKIAATYELAMLLIAEGVPGTQVIPMNKGGTTSVDDLRITLTQAFHSSSYDSSRGTLYAGEAAGVVLSDGCSTIYHAGDTLLFNDMTIIRQYYQPNVALLPIGDRFTMGPAEAAQAAELIAAQLTIPIHYATFPILLQNPQPFLELCRMRKIRAEALKPGASIALPLQG